MATENVLAGVPVRDVERSLPFYERLVGRPADNRPMPTSADWQLSDEGGIQLIGGAEHPGVGFVTINVDDIDARLEQLAERDLRLEATTVPSGQFRVASITDPDGNVITFAQTL